MTEKDTIYLTLNPEDKRVRRTSKVELQPTTRQVETFEERKRPICSCCRNELREPCLVNCQPGRDYSKLELRERADIAIPPRLPTPKEIRTWSATEKFWILYLVTWYYTQP